MTQPATIAQVLQDATRTQGLERLDAQLLLLHALGKADDRAWLITHDGDLVPPDALARFHAAAQRRAAGEPLAYIVGEKEFFGLMLHVDSRVLIPRPDTETLVEWSLCVLAPIAQPRVIDLGTGSGAIALAIRSERPDAEVHALDASADALIVAQANATRLGLPVNFHHSHWLQELPEGDRYDLIVSNPPYIVDGDEHLPALAFEPRQALTAGTDGLDDIRVIAKQALDHLRPSGWLLLEHGYDQAEAVRELLRQAGYANIQSERDLAGIERCTGGQIANPKQHQ